MREILFRGKRKNNGEWIEGYFCGKYNETFFSPAKESAQIIDKDLYWHEVIPETIGQYTGLTDKNGKKIFEGDIISIPFEEDRYPYEENVTYYENAEVYFDTERYSWYVRYSDYDSLSLWEYDDCDIIVIGNIHDDPELIELIGDGKMTNTQRERLIEILKYDNCPSPYECVSDCKYANLENCYNVRTADYLLEHGVIVPPCKVGDVLYELDIFTDYEKCHRCDYYYAGGMGDSPECEKGRYGQRAKECIEIKEKEATQKEILWLLYTNSFGKTAFLTYEAAEQALKGGTE